MIAQAKKDYNWNPSTCTCQNSKYLKRIADTSVIECDENTTVMDKKKNAIATNIKSTASINCHSKKVKNCFILYIVLLAVILLLITIIIYYHAKQKGIDALTMLNGK